MKTTRMIQELRPPGRRVSEFGSECGVESGEMPSYHPSSPWTWLDDVYCMHTTSSVAWSYVPKVIDRHIESTQFLSFLRDHLQLRHNMRLTTRYLTSARTTVRSSGIVRPSFLLARTISTSVSARNAQGQGTKIVQPTLGVAAAMKAMEDSSFTPRVQIFDEFAMKDGVAVVCPSSFHHQYG